VRVQQFRLKRRLRRAGDDVDLPGLDVGATGSARGRGQDAADGRRRHRVRQEGAAAASALKCGQHGFTGRVQMGKIGIG